MAYHCAKKSLVLWIFLELSTSEICDARWAISRASLWRSRWIKNTPLDLIQIVPSSIKPHFLIEGRILFLKENAGRLVLRYMIVLWGFCGGGTKKHKIRDFFIAVMFILKPTSKILTQFQHRLVIKVERQILSHDFCFYLVRFWLLSLEVAGFWT